MPETEQRKNAEILFEPAQSREERKDAIRLEEERRAAIVKNLYRLRAQRLGRNARPRSVSCARSKRLLRAVQRLPVIAVYPDTGQSVS